MKPESIVLPASIATLTYAQVAKTLDHSLLRPELTLDEMRAGCEIAREYDVASVCISPANVSLASRVLEGSDVHVGTVIGFPHGYSATSVKVAEARQAMNDGATELDMVLNIGWLRSGLDEQAQEDIQAVVTEARGKALVKVIIENAYLSDDEKRRACHIAEAAGADFVKTSTGFAPSGATLADLRLMRASVSPRVQVKAAGGVRTLDAVLDVLNVGATRIGATASKAILDEFRARKEQAHDQETT
ncbi:MAG TPA: deoxyribose-phosphate aldolase [Ktedonobacterales bacterium]|nr:deoxyribose-phosphate aldolase [Ktedonobacterales bacterium]